MSALQVVTVYMVASAAFALTDWLYTKLAQWFAIAMAVVSLLILMAVSSA